jgi:hypothetical protein
MIARAVSVLVFFASSYVLLHAASPLLAIWLSILTSSIVTSRYESNSTFFMIDAK